MKHAIAIFLMLSTVFIFSCSSIHNYINKDVNPKGKIAVIIGETKYGKESALYADNFTLALTGGSKLTVLAQNQVKAVLGSYPERIQGPYKVFGMDEPKVDYTRHDMDRIAEIAKKLNVQYVYIFWLASAIKEFANGYDATKYWYIGELIEFPSQRIMAQGNMILFYIGGGLVIGTAPRSVEDMCKIYAEGFAKEMIQNTGIAK